jgi:hypothetical protein
MPPFQFRFACKSSVRRYRHEADFAAEEIPRGFPGPRRSLERNESLGEY